jgi:beta-phosphoglucomutase family hydrolase
LKKEIIIPSHIKGLIFDIDGTIADTMPLHFKATQRVAQEFDFTFELNQFTQLDGIPTEKVFEMVLKEQQKNDLDITLVTEKKEKYYTELLESVKPIDITFNLIKQEYNHRAMSMGTGASRDIALKNILKCGFELYIPHLVTADDVQKHKPHPDTFLKCAELMGLTPTECLVFEDAVPGFQAAQAAGMSYINVLEYFTPQYY